MNYFQYVFLIRGNVKPQSELCKNIVDKSYFCSTFMTFSELDFIFSNDKIAATIMTLENNTSAVLENIKNEKPKQSIVVLQLLLLPNSPI